MLDLLHTISILGLKLDWDEGDTMLYCVIAQLVLFVITVIILGVLISSTRKKSKSNTPETAVTVADNATASQSPETTVTEIVDEQPQADNNDDIIAALEIGNVEESDSGAVVRNADGTTVYYSYNKSFAAKLIQAKDEVREYYNTLVNFVLSYKKVRTDMSWKQESVHYGKEKVCWLVLRGKSLYLYLPLNPDDYADSKYKVERVETKRYEELPCMYKISNNRRVKYATELIATVMDSLGAERTEKAPENFVADYPYEKTVKLIKRGLIKVTKSNRDFANSELTEHIVE